MENISEQKSLEKLGYEPSLIKKIYAFLRPNSIEQAIGFMSMEDGIYQHNFYGNDKNKDNNCYICGEPPFCHINYSSFEINDNEKILENKIQKNSSDNERNTIKTDCNICGDSYPENEFIKYDKCKDSYCSDCWLNYVKGKIENGIVEKINCMNYNCKEILSKEFILSIINSDKNLILKYNKFIKRLEILNDSKKKFCPYPECDSYAEENKNKIVSCKNGHKFCFKCLKNHNEKTNCEDEMDNDFKIWMKNRIVKRCPKCRLWTEKNEGCNHMTCSQCRAQLCWLCGQFYEPNHFNKGKCKGLKFEKNFKNESDIINLFNREVIITNLSFNTDINKLSTYLKKFGKIKDIFILKDKKTGKSKGIAFCKFISEKDSKKAVEAKNIIIDGRNIRIKYSNDNSNSNSNNKNRLNQSNNITKKDKEKKKYEICVKGIPDETNYDSMHTFFKKYGEINDDFLLDKKGIYFCTFSSKDIAQNLVNQGKISFLGKQLKIKFSNEEMNKSREDKNMHIKSNNINNNNTNNNINNYNNNNKINNKINNNNNINSNNKLISNNISNKKDNSPIISNLNNKNNIINNKEINDNNISNIKKNEIKNKEIHINNNNKNNNYSEKYTLFVGNLSYESTENDLKNFFQGCGNVSVRIITSNGKSKGYGYADFDSLENLNKALLKNRQPLNSRPLRLDIEGKDNKFNEHKHSKPFHKKHFHNGY